MQIALVMHMMWGPLNFWNSFFYMDYLWTNFYTIIVLIVWLERYMNWMSYN